MEIGESPWPYSEGGGEGGGTEMDLDYPTCASSIMRRKT